MGFNVADLIEGKPGPVTVAREDSAQVALDLMIEHDYSQLPIITAEQKVEGIVTSDSLIRALNHFRLTIGDAKVSHGIVSVRTFTPEDDLFELLDYLKNVFAAVVVDSNKEIIGIVTNYDTTEYFRRRGEDIMLVEDIESSLREYILAAFQGNGDLDLEQLEAAIDEISPSDSRFRRDFKRAWEKCLECSGIDRDLVDSTHIEEIFVEQVAPRTPTKEFDRLTLSEYIDLFLHKKRWHLYRPVFGLEAASCRNLLEPVREIRNALAHFRGELTSQQRSQLRFCKEWLSRHQDALIEAFEPTNGHQNVLEPQPDVEQPDWEKLEPEVVAQLAEVSSSSESKYAPLATYLLSLPMKTPSLQLTFAEIEKLIGAELPSTARQHRSWWANDSVGHVQSKQWLDVGWRVSNINVSAERCTFSRIEGRQSAYIEFYTDVLAKLRSRPEIRIRDISLAGRNWVVIDSLVTNDNRQLTLLACSFSRSKKFRVELYIDTFADEPNDRIYEALLRDKSLIEERLGRALSWEKLDHRRASRIAAYHPGSITDDAATLDPLRDWAVSRLVEFYELFHVEFRQKIIEAAAL